MKHATLHRAFVALACLGLVQTSDCIYAQSYPNRPIHVVVPYPAGGTANDLRARIIADKLSGIIGQQIIVDNKPGADGAIGTEMVAKAAPDGYTLLLTTYGSFVANPVMFRRVRYDPVNDFEHITQVIATTNLLVVSPSLPVSSVAELIALAKAKPGQLNYATASSAFYLVTEMFKLTAGIDMVYVPYKGSPPAVMALMSGETAVMFEPLQSLISQVRAKRVKPLAVVGARRSPILPDLPTMEESGVPGFEVSTFTGFVAPAGTPKGIVRRLNGAIVKSLHMPGVKDRLENGGDIIVGSAPEEFTAFLKAELARYREVVRKAGIPLVD